MPGTVFRIMATRQGERPLYLSAIYEGHIQPYLFSEAREAGLRFRSLREAEQTREDLRQWCAAVGAAFRVDIEAEALKE